MDRGVWWATVHGVARVKYDSVTNAHVHKTLPLLHTQGRVSGLSHSDSREFRLAPDVINLSFHGIYSLLV